MFLNLSNYPHLNSILQIKILINHWNLQLKTNHYIFYAILKRITILKRYFLNQDLILKNIEIP